MVGKNFAAEALARFKKRDVKYIFTFFLQMVRGEQPAKTTPDNPNLRLHRVPVSVRKLSLVLTSGHAPLNIPYTASLGHSSMFVSSRGHTPVVQTL